MFRLRPRQYGCHSFCVWSSVDGRQLTPGIGPTNLADGVDLPLVTSRMRSGDRVKTDRRDSLVLARLRRVNCARSMSRTTPTKAPARHSPLDLVEAGDLPADAVSVVRTITSTAVPLRLLTRLRPGFRTTGPIPRLPRAVDPRPRELSLVVLMALTAFRSPYAEGFFEAARPESSPLPWPSRALKPSAPSWSPCGA